MRFPLTSSVSRYICLPDGYSSTAERTCLSRTRESRRPAGPCTPGRSWPPGSSSSPRAWWCSQYWTQCTKVSSSQSSSPKYSKLFLESFSRKKYNIQIITKRYLSVFEKKSNNFVKTSMERQTSCKLHLY